MTPTLAKDSERAVKRLTKFLGQYLRGGRYLHRGLRGSEQQKRRILMARVRALSRLGHLLRQEASETLSLLDRVNTDALRAGGFETGEPPSDESDPVKRAAAEYQELLRTSLSASRAAELLGVNSSRIRQRVGSKSPDLYAIKWRHAWVLPHFQFLNEDGLVPNIDRVIRRLPPGLHPLAVRNWFSTSNPDLPESSGSDRNLSPVEWLSLGRSPEKVAELATSIDA